VFSIMNENSDITVNATAARLIQCWMIFLFTVSIQVCERYSEDVRSVSEAAVNFRYVASLCGKTLDNVDLFSGSSLKWIDCH